MKTKVFLTVLFILNLFQMNAQVPNEVTLVVSADGANKEEAVKTALRSAIEQAYGTFVSSNTSILNDELVKDEIVTLSSGNIKGYKELSNETLPNGHIFTTLRATVGIPQLIDYAKSKGAEVEFAGATFAMNIKMEELNTHNEEIIVANMLTTMEKLYMTGFDYKMKVSKVQAGGQMTADIDVYVNENAQKAYDLFYSTLESISLNEKKIKEYKELGKDVYMVGMYPLSSSKQLWFSQNETYRKNKYKRTEGFAFRSEYTLRLLSNFFNYTYLKTLLNISISTNAETSQIQLISSFGKQTNDNVGKKSNFRRYGENINTKIIFDQRIPAYASYLSYDAAPPTDYWRSYAAKDRLLNYIQTINDIENFCFFSYNEEGAAYHPIDYAFIAGYPKHKKGAAIHHIKLNLQIPLDDLMKISKFTITNGNE